MIMRYTCIFAMLRLDTAPEVSCIAVERDQMTKLDWLALATNTRVGTGGHAHHLTDRSRRVGAMHTKHICLG